MILWISIALPVVYDIALCLSLFLKVVPMRILSGDVRIEEALDSVFIFIFLLLLYMLEFSVLLPFLIMNTVFYHRPVRIWYSCILPTLWILVLLILWICIAPLLFMILLYVRAFSDKESCNLSLRFCLYVDY